MMMTHHGLSVWQSMHTPMHLFGMTVFIIGLIAITLWLWSIRQDKSTLLRIAVITLALSVLSGFVITDKGMRDMEMGGNGMQSMMRMMDEHPDMMNGMHEMMTGHASDGHLHDDTATGAGASMPMMNQ